MKLTWKFGSWKFDLTSLDIPDDKDQLVVEHKASNERLEAARELHREIMPMAESLRAYDRRNRYSERLEQSYGRKKP